MPSITSMSIRNENVTRVIENNSSKPVVKLEQTESGVFPFSDAHNRENIAASHNTPGVSVMKSDPNVVYSEAEAESGLEDISVKNKDGVAKHGEIESIATNFTVFKESDAIQYTPEEFLTEGIRMVKTITSHINRLDVGSKLRKEVWLKEIVSLESQGSPSTLIAVCGATGAGKSSALNAILDDNIVPTSGMRACTAVVTEISYHKENRIEADVSFLSEREWKDELNVLLDDLLDGDGQFRRSTDLRTEAGVAWHKVHALYPTLTQDHLGSIARRPSNERVDAILELDPKIARLLGSAKRIVARNSRQFAKQIAKYIDSKDQKRGEKKDKEKENNSPALWPLIRKVVVRCNSPALNTGAILVDLPGVADANAARSSIARDYMKKANCVWILAPITRAVDDKTAKDLLGDAFKSQLMSEWTRVSASAKELKVLINYLNGGFADVESTITFIATKCDDISCSEVIGSLSLEDDPALEEMEQVLYAIRCDIKEWKQKKADAEKAAKGITEELNVIRGDLEQNKEHLEALEEGRKFTPSQTEGGNKKRKSSRGGKGGSPKRRRDNFDESEEAEMADDPDADDTDLDDFIDDHSIESITSGGENDQDDGSDSMTEDGGTDESKSEHNESALSIDDVQAKIKEKKTELKNARERLYETRKHRKEAVDMLSGLSKKQSKAQKDKNAFCSLKRSEFSRDVLKEDFRNGLKELDDAAEEKRNPTGFDPSVNLREYDSIDLPVFTISSRDYIRIKKQVKGDGEPSCFSDVEDTGIPELQKWCHSLTIKSRERAARNFMNQLRVFATSVKNYVDSFGMINEADREALRQKWESAEELGMYAMYESDGDENNDDNDDDGYDWVYQHGRYIPIAQTRTSARQEGRPGNNEHKSGGGIMGTLVREFRGVIASSVEGMQRAFKDGIEGRCQQGADEAAEVSVDISDAFAASMHWCSYRATLRREGVFRRNLNEELISPMTKTIASSWSKTFENNLFANFETKSLDAIEKLLQEFEESCPVALHDRAHHQSQLCLEEVKVSLRKTIDIVTETLTSGQKEVSRCLEPHVRHQLSGGYSRAMEERGRGSVARQKTIFRDYVNCNKNDLFSDGADLILEKLDQVAVSVGGALEEAMAILAEKIEVGLSVLWEAVRDSVPLVRERAEAIKCIDSILLQLVLWENADKKS